MNEHEVLTIAEIEQRYPSAWILIGDPEADEQLRVQSGKVLWHSADRDEVYRKALELRPTHAAFHCTIPLPDDMEFVL